MLLGIHVTALVPRSQSQADKLAEDAPRLTIEGFVAFGGFSVMSDVAPEFAKGMAEAAAWHARHHHSLMPQPDAVM